MPGPSFSRMPAAFQPVLARLAAESSSHFGSDVVRLEPVDYKERPFSHILRVAVFPSGSSRPLTHVFVKIFKVKPQGADRERMARRVVNDFEVTRNVHEAMAGWRDLGAVRPITCYPEHLASVTEEVAGRTLLDRLQSEASWVPHPRRLNGLTATMEQAGRWVRAFQSIDRQVTRMSIASVRSYVEVRLERLTAAPAAGFGPADRARVLEHIDRVADFVAPEDLAETMVHADLAPVNMLVSGGRIVVLDFAMCGRGSVFHDISRLCLQVDLLRLKPQFSGGVIDRLRTSLLHGFDPQLVDDRPMFRLLLLQHRINHLATLSVSGERFPASIYNWHVRRYHRACLERELQRPPEDGARR